MTISRCLDEDRPEDIRLLPKPAAQNTEQTVQVLELDVKSQMLFDGVLD